MGTTRQAKQFTKADNGRRRGIVLADPAPSNAPDPLADNQCIADPSRGQLGWTNFEVGPVVYTGTPTTARFLVWVYNAVHGWLPWREVSVTTGNSRRDSFRRPLPQDRTSFGGFVEGGMMYASADYLPGDITAVCFQGLEFTGDANVVYEFNVAVDDYPDYL